MSELKGDLLRSTFPALIPVVLMTGLAVFENYSGIRLHALGVYPLTLKGLPGIVLSPLVHAGFEHLFSNIIPFFFLTTLLFYFYRDVAREVLVLSWLLPGILVWISARENWHIGASGVVYALTAFHLVSGIVRKNPRLLAISLLMVFLYGGMIWGVFPEFFPGRNISWESHLGGLVTGMILAFYFRRSGPPDPRYSWEDEDEEPPPSQVADPEKEAASARETMIRYIYHEKNREEP